MTNNTPQPNPEFARVHLDMSLPEFETVFDVLQNFVSQVDEGQFGSEDEAPSFHDKARTIRGLNFTFKMR